MKPTNAKPAEVTMNGEAIENSPLGQEVWLAGTNQLVSKLHDDLIKSALHS